jgi:hypothetical protein
MTWPGTEINVIPEIPTPTIPYATRNQGAFRFAIKKVAPSALEEVNLEIRYSSPKYTRIIIMIYQGLTNRK